MILKRLVIIAFFTCFALILFPLSKGAIIDSVKVTGVKVTNSAYILSALNLKKGGVWNDDVSRDVNLKLSGLQDIIENFKVTAEPNKEMNAVDLKIDIVEKAAFIIVPFFTYSSTKGLKPKVVFRDYNLAGYRKYLNAELNYHPTESISLEMRLRDPDVLYNGTFSYQLDGAFDTSVLNYLSHGIAPIGVINWPNLSQRWNAELYYRGSVDGKFYYRDPIHNIIYEPNFSVEYKRIADESPDQAANMILPIDKINPTAGLTVSIPLPGLNGSYFRPSLDLSYSLTLGKEDLSASTLQSNLDNGKVIQNTTQVEQALNSQQDLSAVYTGSAYDSFKPTLTLGFDYYLPLIKASIKPYFRVVYEKVTNYYFRRPNLYYDQKTGQVLGDKGNMYPQDTKHYLDLVTGASFYKEIKLPDTTSHKFTLNGEMNLRVVGLTAITRDFGTLSYPFYFKSLFDFIYQLDLHVYKLHRFKMKLDFFARYNQINNMSGVYSIGSRPGRMAGFLGLIANFKYELPLFLINTPKFVSHQVKRDLLWQVYWDFFIDAGFAVTDVPFTAYGVDYTLDYHYLHLSPGFSIGTGIRVVPKFLPLDIVLNLGFDIYNMLKTKTLSGNDLIIEFSLNDQF